MTPDLLSKIVGKPANSNMYAFLAGMQAGGHRIHWDMQAAKAHIVAQVAHESFAFLYDREIWGPTDAQRRYEDRSDLGHSSAVAGEAYKFRGHGPMQVTGRYNHREYYLWARTNIDPNAPNFEEQPEAILTDPWEGLSVVWYWETRSLHELVAKNDFENITKRINGGLNGYNDRMKWFGRAALGILGRDPGSLVAYQREKGLIADGIAGPNTRGALFADLMQLPADRATPSPVISKEAEELAKALDKLSRINAITEE